MEASAVLELRTAPAALRTDTWPLRMLGVLAFAGVLFFARLGERALWSEEVRWLQIPREMQRSGDWFWPTINGQTYYDKPLGSYWLVLLSSCVTGTLDENAARLPSAVCGLLAVAWMMLIARRLCDDNVALWAGIILATSFSFVFFARTAATDIETVAGVLAALWIFLKLEDRPSGWWIIALWLAMALTSLTKGLLGFALPILILTAYGFLRTAHAPASRWQKLARANRWLLHPASLLAIPLAIGIYVAPFALSMAGHGSADGLAMVYRENIQRFFDPVNHRGPIYLYGYVIFMLLAPWSLLLPAALVHAHWRPDKDCQGRLFALAYFWATFVFYTLSASRRSYYLLPILPAGALLIAQLITRLASPPVLRGRGSMPRGEDIAEGERRVTNWLVRAGLAVLTLALVVSAAALLPVTSLLPEPWHRLPALPCAGWFVAAWMASFVGIVWAWVKFEPCRVMGAFGCVAVTFMAYWYLAAQPALEEYRTQRPFADAVKREIELHGLSLYGTREIVAHLDPPAPLVEYHTPAALSKAIEAHRVDCLIVRRRDWANLHLAGSIVIAETVQPWEDAALAQSKLLLIRMP